MDRRKIVAKHREDRDTIHHCGFEQESFSLRGREGSQFFIGMNDGALVGGDRVSAVFESGADVIDSRLAIVHAEGRGLKQHVGLGHSKPLS